MSKKSRRRNKRLLALAGLAGAVALSKRKAKADLAGTEDGKGGIDTIDKAKQAMTSDAAYSTKKDTSKSNVTVEPKKVNNNTFRTRQRITDSAGNTVESAGTARADNKSKVTNVTRPGENMYSSVGTSNPRKAGLKSGGRAKLKSGGKVKGCGKALRGFGKAMKKGKR